MENELNMKEIIEYEKNRKNKKITNAIIEKLWEFVKSDYDTYELREAYKNILMKLKKYDTNYYAWICIALNVMTAKKEFFIENNYKVDFDSLKYLKQRIAGEITIDADKEYGIVRYTTNEVKYDYIRYKEGIGKEKTKGLSEKLINSAKEILREEKLDLNKGKIWARDYRKYIIKTYGRASKEYEKYMNITFEMQVILMSPNILLLAMRETLRRGIEVAVRDISE